MKILKTKPKDYHCNCFYCKKFLGEIRNDDGSYISARKRIGYSDYEKKHKHIALGHWQGYSFAIDRLTKKGDIILDPFCGSATALVEAAKLERKGIGIELEFGKIAESNIKKYRSSVNILNGDCRNIVKTIKAEFDLILTGPVYNNHSDPPERKNLKGKNQSFDYKKKDSFSFMEDFEYQREMLNLFGDLYAKTKKGGYFVLIIKDPIRNKEPYLLHRILTDCAEIAGYKPIGVYIHRHWPPTLFQNTYSKRFPKVKIPLYQTLTVLRK